MSRILLVALLSATSMTATSSLAAQASSAKVVDIAKDSFSALPEIDTKKSSYAMGLLLSRQITALLNDQKELDLVLSEEDILRGIQDGLGQRAEMAPVEVEETLKQLGLRTSKTIAVRVAALAKKRLEEGERFRQKFAKERGVKKSPTGLLYRVDKQGQGRGKAPQKGDLVVVHYKGSLLDGTEFDSSYKRGAPETFVLNQIIPGWAEGLQKIKQGGKMKMVIPPQLAYGENGNSAIPGNATLIFEVELLEIKPSSEARETKSEDNPS